MCRLYNVVNYAKGSAIYAQSSNLKNYAKPKMERNDERIDLEVKKRKVTIGISGVLV